MPPRPRKTPPPPPPTRSQTSPATKPDETERLHILSVSIPERDLEHVFSMMQASGAASFHSLLLSALYSYGQHLECGVPTRAFDLAGNRPLGRRRRDGAQITKE